jgi:preprotein translocase subunit SecD
MLDFPRWKIWAVILTLFIGCAYAVPTFLPEKVHEALPSVFRAKVNLGLDLSGGSYILLEGSTEDVAKRQLEVMEEQIRTELRRRDDRIAIGDISSSGGRLAFMVRDVAKVDAAVERIRKLTEGAQMSGQRNFNVEVRDGTTIVVTPTEAGIAEATKSAMDTATEVVRKRVDATGTREPTVLKQGAGSAGPDRAQEFARQDRQA